MRLGLRDLSLLSFDLSDDIRDPGLCLPELRLRLSQRGLEVAVIDAREQSAGLDKLIVLSRHFCDEIGRAHV